MSNAIELREHETSVMERGTMSPTSVLAHVAKVQEIMDKLLKKDEHYGVIPGTNKPTLLKPGAEKLSFAFRLLPKFRVTKTDLPNLHREYELVCELWHESGVFAGEGVGSCSTMESKYRYRNAAKKCPTCGKETIIKGKEEYGGGWLCFAKKGGCGAKFPENAPEIVSQPVGKVVNADIADVYNTVLKMAKKRALVDATITACAASDIFTQDVEDLQQGGDPIPVEHTESPRMDGATKAQEQLDRIANFSVGMEPEKKKKQDALVHGWAEEGRGGKITIDQYAEKLRGLADDLEAQA
jgi:hypothetical protein